MKARFSYALIVLAAATAAAQDGTKPASPIAPAAPQTPAAPARKERRTTPEAEAAIKRYVGLLHFPNPVYKKVEMNSHCELQMLGGEVGCKFSMKESGDIALDVVLPEAVREQYGDAQLVDIKKTAAGWVGGYFRPFLVPLDVTTKQYDLASRTEDGRTIVDLVRFAEHAAWEKATLWFSKEGLLEKQVGTPNVDPDDPLAAMNAGAEIELTIDYKKRGELYTVEGGKLVEPLGESTVKLSYYEIPDKAPLPKELAVTTPMMPDTLVIALHDYVLDGKAVAGTARKRDEPAPASPPAPKTEPAKPSEPAKR
jgi:hypothetical protein